jgi:hypothetical protein
MAAKYGKIFLSTRHRSGRTSSLKPVRTDQRGEAGFRLQMLLHQRSICNAASGRHWVVVVGTPAEIKNILHAATVPRPMGQPLSNERIGCGCSFDEGASATYSCNSNRYLFCCAMPLEEDDYQKYKNVRYESHIARKNGLSDFAFKTSERYDQWVLTLSGGALAISLTFLEKIAPDPASNTLFLLGLSWLAYISAVLAGFGAIYISREAIYRELEIDEEVYGQFRKTSTEDNPEGEILPDRENRFIGILKILNRTSISCLALGTFLMCCFALANITGAKSKKMPELPTQINVNVNMPPAPTNSMTITNKGQP